MRALERILAAIDVLGRAAAGLAALMTAALAALVVAQIVANAVFAADLGITVEYGAYMLVLIVFAAAAEAARTGAHIRVALALTAAPPAWRRPFELVSTSVAVATLAYIALALSDMALRSLHEGSRTYLPSRTLLVYPQAALAACTWLLVLQFAARLVRCIAGLPPDLDLGDTEAVGEP